MVHQTSSMPNPNVIVNTLEQGKQPASSRSVSSSSIEGFGCMPYIDTLVII